MLWRESQNIKTHREQTHLSRRARNTCSCRIIFVNVDVNFAWQVRTIGASTSLWSPRNLRVYWRIFLTLICVRNAKKLAIIFPETKSGEWFCLLFCFFFKAVANLLYIFNDLNGRCIAGNNLHLVIFKEALKSREWKRSKKEEKGREKRRLAVTQFKVFLVKKYLCEKRK